MPQCLKNVWGTSTLWLAKIFFPQMKGTTATPASQLPPPPDQDTTQGYKNVTS